MKTQGNKSNRRQLKQGTFAYLDDLIFKWLLNVRSRNVVVSASILKTKAKELAEKINIKGFQASDGWLDRWKNRYNVSFKTVSGEGNSCTDEMMMNLGCFFVFSLMSHLIFDLKVAQRENSKIRLTGMATANASGHKILIFVISKSKSPCCFKGVKYLPCRYRNQNKNWLDSILFEEWIREVEKKFAKEKKNVALIIGNCPAHPTIDNLKSIELIFLPPNTTSKLQPMDQGVIRFLKTYCKGWLWLSIKEKIFQFFIF